MKEYEKLVLKYPIWLGLATVGISFFSVWIFTLPAFHSSLDLSGKGEIGDTIGGITAPIIGIFGTILLYLSLSLQRVAIREEKSWNKKRTNGDILNFYLNDIKDEYYNLSKNGKNGIHALYEIANSGNISNYENIDPVLSITHSVKNFISRINEKTLEITSEDKTYFETAIKDFYKFKLYKSLKVILRKIDPVKHSELIKEINRLKTELDNYAGI